MPSLARERKRISINLTRGARLFFITAPICVLALFGVWFVNRSATMDVITTEAAVPLAISYVMIRMIMRRKG